MNIRIDTINKTIEILDDTSVIEVLNKLNTMSKELTEYKILNNNFQDFMNDIRINNRYANKN